VKGREPVIRLASRIGTQRPLYDVAAVAADARFLRG
jgi:hypothetical protein